MAVIMAGPRQMSDSIFISYRRDDSRHAAGRLHERLAKRFHSSRIFMDIDSIPPGIDFAKMINERVSRSRVLLAVIGPRG
jgi:hypothetical protein